MKIKLLNSLFRNFRHIEKLEASEESGTSSRTLSSKELWELAIIKKLYAQQNQMYQTRSNQCPNRIVSLSQPHVRPIKRGKEKNKTEFGTKIGASLNRNFIRLDHLSWDAYHEGKEDFIPQVEAYHSLHGYYPELVLVDKIYHTQSNRKWAAERAIRLTAKPLGRPAKENAYQKSKRKKEATERNRIEGKFGQGKKGKFGQGKNGYPLNKIRAKLQKTSESWIACILFVMNLINLEKIYFCTLSKWAFFRYILPFFDFSRMSIRYFYGVDFKLALQQVR